MMYKEFLAMKFTFSKIIVSWNVIFDKKSIILKSKNADKVVKSTHDNVR